MDHDRTAARLSADEADARARQLITEAYAPPTSHRDETPLPAYGPTPPVAQPGRPPMSQKATDASALMLAAGASSLLIGGSASLVLFTAGHADPVTVALITGAPIAFVAVLGRVLKRAKDVVEAAPAEIHNHYTGPVDHRITTTTTTTTTKGMFARTRNDVHK
ncbi:hypothetical protein [Streptomyces sp. NPDC056361]|uniref:hypothetical protein n=1 Tax=Streptomyces sp. NPDC056361 TaxID=3345795 RepID=UPI0035D7B700